MIRASELFCFVDEVDQYASPGDVLAFAGTTLFSRMVQLFSKSHVSHIGMFCIAEFTDVNDSSNTIASIPCLLDSQEPIGVRLKPINHAISDYLSRGGSCWLYELNDDVFDRNKIISGAIRYLGQRYASPKQFMVITSRMYQFLYRLLYGHLDTSYNRWHCSEFVSFCLALGGADFGDKEFALIKPAEILRLGEDRGWFKCVRRVIK